MGDDIIFKLTLILFNYEKKKEIRESREESWCTKVPPWQRLVCQEEKGICRRRKIDEVLLFSLRDIFFRMR